MIATSQIPNNLTVGTSNDCSEIYRRLQHRAVRHAEERVGSTAARPVRGNGRDRVRLPCVRDVIVQYPAALALVTGVRA